MTVLRVHSLRQAGGKNQTMVSMFCYECVQDWPSAMSTINDMKCVGLCILMVSKRTQERQKRPVLATHCNIAKRSVARSRSGGGYFGFKRGVEHWRDGRSLGGAEKCSTTEPNVDLAPVPCSSHNRS